MSVGALALFPPQAAIGRGTVGNQQVLVYSTPEFFRALQVILTRTGGNSSEPVSVDQLIQDDISAPFMVSANEGLDLSMIEAPAGMLSDPDYAPGDTPMVFQTPPYIGADAAPDPMEAMSVSASPVSITATRRCAINIDGSIVWQTLTVTRGATTVPVSGNTVELDAGDVLAFEYVSAPALTLIPRQS